jgi:hypothetical protein
LIPSTAGGALQSGSQSRADVVDALLELIGNTLLVHENAQALRVRKRRKGGEEAEAGYYANSSFDWGGYYRASGNVHSGGFTSAA